MTQAFEIGKFSDCEPRRQSWWSRLLTWLFQRPARESVIPWDQRSDHLLRDIGLAEGLRDNDLLREHHFGRR